jgi:two-component system, chemotaxis family, chemotaxis protein CheY
VSSKQLEKLIEPLDLLIVDENQYTRKLTRMMLMNIGGKSIFEAADGITALDIIRNVNPAVMLMDWELRLLSAPQVMHIVRSPGEFAKPFLPIIMLASYPSRTRVTEAIRLGVHEVVAKPTSPKILQDRLLSILVNPRPMVQVGRYYVPEPRGLPPKDGATMAASERADPRPKADATPRPENNQPAWTPLPRRSPRSMNSFS